MALRQDRPRGGRGAELHGASPCNQMGSAIEAELGAPVLGFEDLVEQQWVVHRKCVSRETRLPGERETRFT